MITHTPVFRSSLSTSLRKLTQRVVDSGLLGLTPLEKHVVICGFPRSGSTLLLLITECCIVNARTFGKGQPAIPTAERAFRNHRIMITKRPRDLFCLSEIRRHYGERAKRTQLRSIVTTRDPRAILTSRHAKNPSAYYVEPARWLATYEAYQAERARPDVITVRFEDLIMSPGAVEAKLTDFIGWSLRRPFERYYEEASQKPLQSRLTQNLNGVRPLDPGSLAKWRQPIHRERIRQLLAEIPQLPEYLVEMGYEQNAEWVQDYA
jgi:hypothetical protein